VRQLHSSVTAQIAKLDVQEERLLDLATDDALPKARIRTRLRKITDQRSNAQASLVDSTAQLALGGDLLRRYLELVTDPVKLYARLPDSGRRLLNQAFFDRLFLDEERVQHDVKTPELAQLQAVQRHDAAWTGARALARNQRAPDQPARGVTRNTIDLLGSIELVDVSSKAVMVELRGIEPRTSSMRTKRATNCATAPSRVRCASDGCPSRISAAARDVELAQAGRKHSPCSTGTATEVPDSAARAISSPCPSAISSRPDAQVASECGRVRATPR